MVRSFERSVKGALCAASAVLVAFAGSALLKDTARAESASGSCGGDATYVLTDDGTMTISGTGYIDPNFYVLEVDYETGKIDGISVKKIIINDGIEGIDEYAFGGCSSVESVSLPSSCDYIGYMAFYYCDNLQTLDMSEGLTYIDEKAFEGCSSLESLILPEGLEIIDSDAFSECSSLKTLVIPGSVSYLLSSQFGNCTQLEEVTLSADTFATSYAFFNVDSIALLHYDGSASQLGNLSSLFEEIEYSKFDVKYNYLDNHSNYDNKIVVKGECAEEVLTPLEPWVDHTFTGEWYTDPECTPENRYDFETPVTSDIVLYAKWTEDQLAVLEGYQVILTGDIGVKFYVFIPESIRSEEDAKIVISNEVPQGKTPLVKTYPVSGADTEQVGGNSYCVFTFEVPAATMTCPISVSLEYGDKKVSLGDDFTVRAYGEYIMKHRSEYEAYEQAYDLVNAMLNYGAYSQIYFGINTDDLANKNAFDYVANADPGEYNGIPVKYLPEDPPITYYGSSLSFESKVSAIVYFKVANGVNYKDYSFQIQSGVPIIPEENETPGYISIRIDDIDPAKLTAETNTFVIRISGGPSGAGVGYNYDYSPLYVMQAACASETVSGNMKNLSKALYLYGVAAKAYVG